MNYSLLLIIYILFGALAMNMAKKRNRRHKLWFALGFLFGLLGVIVLYFLPKVEDKKTIKTRSPKPTIIKSSKLWYYLDKENKQYGPMSDHALKQNLAEAKYVWNDAMDEWAEPEKVEELESSPS